MNPPTVAPTLYFGYGSNLGKRQMALRCPHHRDAGRASLPGYRWIISRRGVANVVIAAGDAVERMLFEISASDEAALDIAEGVAKGRYAKHHLPVVQNGVERTAMLYIDPIVEMGVARSEYVQRINTAVADAQLPVEYVTKYIRQFIPTPEAAHPA